MCYCKRVFVFPCWIKHYAPSFNVFFFVFCHYGMLHKHNTTSCLLKNKMKVKNTGQKSTRRRFQFYAHTHSCIRYHITIQQIWICLKEIVLEITWNHFKARKKSLRWAVCVQACSRKSRLLGSSDGYPLLTWLTFFFICTTVRLTAPNLSVLDRKKNFCK